MQQWYTFFSLKMLFYGTSQFPTMWTHSTFANYVSPLKRQFTLQTTTAILFLCTSHLCPHIRWLISFCTTFTSSRVWLPNHYVVISWNVKPKRVNAKSSVTWHWAAAVLPHFCKTYDLQRAWFWSHLGHASNLDFFFQTMQALKKLLVIFFGLLWSLACYSKRKLVSSSILCKLVPSRYELQFSIGILQRSLTLSLFFATTASQLWPNIFSEKKKIEIFIPAAGQEWLPFLSSFQLLFFRCCQIAWWVLYKF